MIIYFILTYIFFILFIPFFIFIYFQNEERLIPVKGKYDYWIHCSSVGEVKMVKSLIDELKGKILITTFTESGRKVASSIYRNIDVRLLPLDLPYIIYKSLKNIKIKFLILVECEIWPSLIYFAKKNQAKIIIINGRINMKNKFLKIILSKILSKNIDFIFPAGLKNRENFLNLGFPENKLGFTENLKFDVEPSIVGLKKEYKLERDVLVFGSIREGEEKIVIDNLPDNAISIIAPRHLNRVDYIKRLLEEKNIKFSLYSTGKYSGEKVVILDEIGSLVDFYKIADLVFIGGTIMNYGGHNPIEAAYFGKPVLAGKFTSSIDDFFEECIKKDGCLKINKDLRKEIEKLLNDKETLKIMGKNAKGTLDRMKGSKENIINYIRNNQ